MRDRVLLRVLRAAQEPRKLTQAQLAKRAGLSAARYWQIENGEGADPSENEMNAIAAALGVSPDAIAWPHLESQQRAS